MSIIPVVYCSVVSLAAAAGACREFFCAGISASMQCEAEIGRRADYAEALGKITRGYLAKGSLCLIISVVHAVIAGAQSI